MKTFVATRLGAMVAILVALTGVMFLLQHISPLDPVKAQLGAQASAAGGGRPARGARAQRADPGAVLALPDRRGDRRPRHVVPHPPRRRRPISATFFPATLELALYGLAIALVLAVLLAFSTTLKWRGAGLLRAVLFTGSSAPMFLLGILGLIVFYQKLGWVPANGRIAIAEPARPGPPGC